MHPDLAQRLPELTGAVIAPLEDSFITRHLNEPVTIFLTNGVKLSGIITANSPNAMLLTRDNTTQLVMKQAIATVMPQGGA